MRELTELLESDAIASIEHLKQYGHTRIAVPSNKEITLGSPVTLDDGREEIVGWVIALISEGEEVTAIDGLEGDQLQTQRVTIATLSLQRVSPCLN